jgi:hypothetical protein
MIARERGDRHGHRRWHAAASAAAPPSGTDPELLGDDESDTADGVDRPRGAPRRSFVLIAVAAVIGIAVIAGKLHAGRAPNAPLPATPRQWVDEWTAASLENPARVCGHLFAPALAAAFNADTGRSCVRYYTSVNSFSFRIRRVLKDGPTATVEGRQVAARPKWGYFTIVLSRIRGGWQAVDLVPGGPVRPR